MNLNNQGNLLSKNIKLFSWIRILSSSALIWSVTILYFQSKGLSFGQIALIQSIGALFSIVLEIPCGYFADKRGLKNSLFMGAACNFIAVGILALSSTFYMFLLSELFFALASSLISGADTALFYNSLNALNRKDDYITVLSKIRSKASLLRGLGRLVAPALFSLNPVIPFWFTTGIFFAITILTNQYTNPHYEKTTKANDDEDKIPVHWMDRIKMSLIKYRTFLLISFVSMIIFTIVSNYSQFLGPFLKAQTFSIAALGIVLSIGSLFDYFGAKVSPFLHQHLNKNKSMLIIFSLGILIGLALILSIGFKGYVAGICAYFAICFLHSIFTIWISDAINLHIEDHNRATLLSVSNAIDQFGTLCIDPILGIYLDLLGFGKVYLYLGFGSVSVLILTFTYLSIYSRKRNKTQNEGCEISELS